MAVREVASRNELVIVLCIAGGSVNGRSQRATILKTGDNKQVIVPNSQIMDSIITNYSAHDTRRVDMVIGVSYADDLDKVRATLENLINVRPHRSHQEAL